MSSYDPWRIEGVPSIWTTKNGQQADQSMPPEPLRLDRLRLMEQTRERKPRTHGKSVVLPGSGSAPPKPLYPEKPRKNRKSWAERAAIALETPMERRVRAVRWKRKKREPKMEDREPDPDEDDADAAFDLRLAVFQIVLVVVIIFIGVLI